MSEQEHRDDVDAVRERYAADPPQAMTGEDAARLTAITDALGSPSFPTTREALLERAEAGGARDAVVVDLRSLPDNARYDSYDALLLALGVGMSGRVDVPGTPRRDPQGGTPGQRREATNAPD